MWRKNSVLLSTSEAGPRGNAGAGVRPGLSTHSGADRGADLGRFPEALASLSLPVTLG